MQKAKSRLSDTTRSKLRHKRSRGAINSGALKRYLRFLPLLVISLLLYGSLYWLVTHISPNKIAHIIFPNSYLPFTLILFFANLLFFSYLLLNTRRGFILSSLIAVLVFLKLQKVVFEWSWILPLFGTVLLIEIIFTTLQKYSKTDN